jgi:hypothetical protein
MIFSYILLVVIEPTKCRKKCFEFFEWSFFVEGIHKLSCYFSTW